MYLCEKCGVEVFDNYGSGRFCSFSCACSRNIISSESHRNSISESLKKLPKVSCKYCNKLIRESRIETHELKCSTVKSYLDTLPDFIVFNVSAEKYYCSTCDKSFSKYGIKNHISAIHENKEIGFKKGHIPWSKGLKLDTSNFKLHVWTEEERLGISIKKKEYAKNNPYHHSDDIRQDISNKMKSNGSGGYRKGSGRGKKGWYKGIFCDSSWELAVVIYCLENNIEIKRNTEMRNYIFEGVNKNYLPDFYINGILTEIKGYKTKQWEAKILFNDDIKVIGEEEIKFYIEYVESKYGKNFIELYELNVEGTV